MLPRLQSGHVQLATNGIYHLRCLRNCSSFNRNRKFYELTVDEDEREIKNQPNPLADIEHRINESKKKLVWRLPPTKPPSLVTDLLGMFTSERQRAAHLQQILKPIPFDFTWKTFAAGRQLRRIAVEKLLQSFIAERHEILGNNLAAAHFLIFRGAQIRFTKSPKWLKKDENDDYELPSHFDQNWIVDGIKCDGIELYYEGWQNIRRLYELKFFSVKNIKLFDDWCLDRLAGSQFDKLEVLDISGTNITANGLVAVPKIASLKLLVLSDIKRSTEFELSVHMLQDEMPNLEIREVNDSSTQLTLPTPKE